LRVLTATIRGSTGTEVGKEGEGTPAKAAAELVVTAGAQSSSHGFGYTKGRSSIRGGMAVWISAVSAGLNKGVELNGR
jgi:hypothetical protein